MKKCPKCNVEVADNAKFCSDCGYAFPEPVVTPPAATVEKSAEENFDHKPLVMEWYQNSGLAKFLFNVWPKLHFFGNLASIILVIVGVFLGGFGMMRNIPDVGEMVPEAFDTARGLALLSTGLGLKVFLFAVNLVLNNDLKKILFSNFLKKKGVDLETAAKYVFFNLSHDNFSSIPRKEKGNLVAWLASPQYFGEAVMMASKSESKKTNIIWMCVYTGVSFICQTVENSVLLLFVQTFFNIDFDDTDTLAALPLYLFIFIGVSIAVSIANAIITSIYKKKKAEVKAVWALTATNPDVANKDVITVVNVD